MATKNHPPGSVAIATGPNARNEQNRTFENRISTAVGAVVARGGLVDLRNIQGAPWAKTMTAIALEREGSLDFRILTTPMGWFSVNIPQ